MMGLRMSQPARKPNIWAVASVTYGAVILVAIISVVAYYFLAPKRTPSQQLTDAERSMAVGSVWMPIYPGATVESTGSTKQDSATDSVLTFATKDQVDRVLSFYQAALKKGVFRFNTVKKDDGGGTVRSMAHEGKTTVTVTIRTTAGGSEGEIRTVDRDTGDKDRPK
jgi:hypothetical protein